MVSMNSSMIAGTLSVSFIGDLLEAHAIRLEHQPVQGLLQLVQARLAQLRALDEVALVVVAVLAAQKSTPSMPVDSASAIQTRFMLPMQRSGMKRM